MYNHRECNVNTLHDVLFASLCLDNASKYFKGYRSTVTVGMLLTIKRFFFLDGRGPR